MQLCWLKGSVSNSNGILKVQETRIMPYKYTTCSLTLTPVKFRFLLSSFDFYPSAWCTIHKQHVVHSSCMRQAKHKNRVPFYLKFYSACFSLVARLTQVWDQVSLLSSLMSPFLISKYRHKEVIAIGREIKDTCHLLSGHKTICVKLLPS